MRITTDPDVETVTEWRVLRQMPGQPKPRIWNRKASRNEAVAEICARRPEQSPRIRWAVQRVERTEVLHMPEWDADYED